MTGWRGRESPPPIELFLSHSARNRAFAAKLAALLRRHGIPTWFSQTHILGAQQWHDEIGAALGRCEWFLLLLLTPAAVKSRWVKHELLYALNDVRYEGHIVPVLYRNCDFAKLSWTLGSFQMVDFTRDSEAGCRNLLKIWGLTHPGASRSTQ